jgi:hypothetical protein
VSRSPNPDVLRAISTLAASANFIHTKFPLIGLEDLVNSLIWTEGRPRQTAAILDALNRHRTRGDHAPKQHRPDTYR